MYSFKSITDEPQYSLLLQDKHLTRVLGVELASQLSSSGVFFLSLLTACRVIPKPVKVHFLTLRPLPLLRFKDRKPVSLDVKTYPETAFLLSWVGFYPLTLCSVNPCLKIAYKFIHILVLTSPSPLRKLGTIETKHGRSKRHEKVPLSDDKPWS